MRESMDKNRIKGASTGRAGNVPRSPYPSNGAKRRFGDCARKAAELTPGDLPCVAAATESARGGLTAEQKSAESVIGHVVGEAREALQCRKAEATDRPSRNGG